MNLEYMSYINMNSTQIFISNNFELIVVLLFVTLLIIVSFFMKNVEKKISLKSSEMQNPEKYLQLLTNIRELLEATRNDSYQMLSKVNEESVSILKDSLNFSENMRDSVRKKAEIVKKNYLQELKINSSRLSQQFQEEYKKEFASSLQSLKAIDNSINKRIMEEADGLLQDIHLHLNSNHDLIVKKIDEDMGKTEEFLSTYRKNKVEEFDKEFKNMANFYVKDYLKKTLSFDEHEEIIRNIVKDFEKSVK